MTTSAATNTERRLPLLDTLREGWAVVRRSLTPQSLRRLLREERHWLWIAIPLIVLIYPSVLWASSSWNAFDYALITQPITPLVALALALSRQQEIRELYLEMAFLFPADSPKRRGKLWVTLIGCFLMLIASLLTASTLAFIALLIMVVGAIYYLYGPFLVRALWQPLLLMVLVIPPPASFIHGFSTGLQIAATAIASQVLQNISLGSSTQRIGREPAVIMPHYQMIVPSSFSGVNIIFVSAAIILWFCLFRRYKFGITAILLTVSTAIASFLNVFRVIFFALLGNSNDVAADSLRSDAAILIGSLLLTVVVVALTLYVARLITAARYRRISDFEADLREAMLLAEEQKAAEGTEMTVGEALSSVHAPAMMTESAHAVRVEETEDA